ncbi:hypothetical protein BRYFOR_07314 [Marvinbryantia formatexigens DSM 14469]|uniref:Uncharacterized protein n=1 Tax=Marvinbryantia formatexigens DSM 14469 TaxID=478749 RepID=C6LFB2_9FIRM|nr:hypothetical protein BRYFOR_07314 [Marvinbryantia formatexigens DSM 14469]
MPDAGKNGDAADIISFRTRNVCPDRVFGAGHPDGMISGSIPFLHH